MGDNSSNIVRNNIVYEMKFDEPMYINFMKSMTIRDILLKQEQLGKNNGHYKILEKINDVEIMKIVYDVMMNNTKYNRESAGEKGIYYIAIYYMSIFYVEKVIEYYEMITDNDDNLLFLYIYLVNNNFGKDAKKYLDMIIDRNLLGKITYGSIMTIHESRAITSDDYNNIMLFKHFGIEPNFPNDKSIISGNNLSCNKDVFATKRFSYALIKSQIINGQISIMFDTPEIGCDVSWGVISKEVKLQTFLDNIVDEYILDVISKIPPDEVKNKCKLIQVLYRLINNIFDNMKLHFEYSVEGKGYDNAKKDFLDYIKNGYVSKNIEE